MTRRLDGSRLRSGVLFAPVVFVAHFLEEGPRFVPWFNAHVARGITADLFWTVNATALLIMVFVVLVYRAGESAVASVILAAWLSFLMLTNAIFHIAGAIVDQGYVPGLATAILLYLPYCGWVAAHSCALAEWPRDCWPRPPWSEGSRWRCTGIGSCSLALACSRRAR